MKIILWFLLTLNIFANNTLFSSKNNIDNLTTSSSKKWSLFGINNYAILYDNIKDKKYKFSFPSSSVAISQDEQYFATSGNDERIRIWDLKTKKLIITLGNPSNYTIEDMAFHPNKKEIAIASIISNNYRGVYVIDFVTGEVKIKFQVLERYDGINIVKYSPNGKYITTGSSDRNHLNEINLYNSETGKLLKSFKHGNSISDLKYLNDKILISSAYSDTCIKIWDIEKETLLKKIKLSSYRDGIRSIDIFNNILVYSHFEEAISLINLNNTEQIIEIQKPQGKRGFYSKKALVSLISNSHLIITSDRDDKVRKIDISSYNDDIAADKYKKLDKDNIIVLSNFISKYNNSLNTISKANIKLISLKKNELEKQYKAAIKDNNINSYKSFIVNYPNLDKEHLDSSILKIYTLVLEENNISGYEWFIENYPNSLHSKDAMNAIYKLAYSQAENIDTISSYNTFIISYPYAKQIKDANDKAYKLDLVKYTDIGIIDSIFNKDNTMEKNSRKLLIKAKQIERLSTEYNSSNAGYILISNRMYNLLQSEFDDSEATLRHLESQEFKDFVNIFRDTMNKIKIVLNDIRKHTKEIIKVSKNGFSSSKADRDMTTYKLKKHEEWTKYMHFRDKGYI